MATVILSFLVMSLVSNAQNITEAGAPNCEISAWQDGSVNSELVLAGHREHYMQRQSPDTSHASELDLPLMLVSILGTYWMNILVMMLVCQRTRIGHALTAVWQRVRTCVPTTLPIVNERLGHTRQACAILSLGMTELLVKHGTIQGGLEQVLEPSLIAVANTIDHIVCSNSVTGLIVSILMSFLVHVFDTVTAMTTVTVAGAKQI